MLVSSRQFGPRYIQLPDLLLDDGGDFERERVINGGGGSPPPLPDPIRNAEELAGGLTLAQLDQAARMEVEEGAPSLIAYGELLLAGTLVSHKYTATTPKKNEFTVILGEGWGGLGRHGEWEGPVKVWYKGEELSKLLSYQIYIDDALPAGASQQNDTDGWNWIATNPTPYAGKYAHQSPNMGGSHQHFFRDATQTMAVQTGSILFAFVYLDPVNPPQEIMLQWQDDGGSFDHRAYWGANLIPLGVDGTDSRRNMGALPPAGEWVRLDTPASQVGLEGQTVKGMAFTCFNGQATWDQAGLYSVQTTQPGYVFRPGVIATNSFDVQQISSSNLPSGLTYNGSANIFVRLTEAQSQEDRPDGLKCRIKCRRVYDWDATGAEIGYGYSANPARVAADRILHFYEQRFRDNLDLARQKFRARVHWPSWAEWRDYCDQLIPWDKDGNGQNVFIRRFEAHIGFNTDLSLAQALDQITGLSATIWQDDGDQLIFLPPNPRPPVHHFHPGNIVGGGINISVTDLRQRPNRFIAHFRDIDDPWLGAAAVEPPEFTPEWDRRQRAIARVGEIRTERQFSNMTQSQASRIITYRAQLEFHNPITYSFVGMADAFKVLPGDFVTISHPQIEREYQLCLVTGIRKRSVQSSADEIGFLLQRIDGPLYDDAAHRPRQEALEL